ncbi:MAG: cytidylate kinase-like family protein [Clostridiales bacterium]|nr:cytidylate kinase-like family protein [Clostridiales bacterium]
MNQLIISVGREFGSAGHEIAQKLAEHYQIPLYDHNLLDEIAKKHNVNGTALEEFDEVRWNKLLYRSVNGMNSSPHVNVANLQFSFLKEKAEAGESFVVVGRCSETVLKDYPCMVSIFVTGNLKCKAARIMDLYHLSEKEALDLMRKKDKKRKTYHNSHCENKWGDSRNYDLCMNSSKPGVEKSVGILIDYIDASR